MEKTEFIRSVQRADEMFMIFTELTHRPYIHLNPLTQDDEVFVYMDEEKAVEQVKKMNEESPIRAQNVRVNKESMLNCFSELFTLGVNAVRVTKGNEVYNLQLSEIVRRPMLENVPIEKRPIENPELQLSMLYFMQEIRKGIKEENKATYAAMEEEMRVNILRAKFVLPLKNEEENGEKKAKMVVIKLPNGKAFVPVLSDMNEFMRFRASQTDIIAAVTDAEKMAGMELSEEIEGFLINPPTASVPVKSENLKRWLQSYSWK